MVVTGLLADGRQLWQLSKDEAESFRMDNGHNIPIDVLTDRVKNYVHAYTLHAGVRPFGTDVFFAGWSRTEGSKVGRKSRNADSVSYRP